MKEGELTGVLDSIPGGVAIFSEHNGKAHIEYANHGFYEIHHGSREYWDSVSSDPIEWLIPEDKEKFMKAFGEVNSGRTETGNAAYRITDEKGNFHWVNNQFRFAYIMNGISYYYASFTDLDELKAAEQSRAEARRMYEAAVEDANLVVWEYDIADHRITMAENEFTEYDYRKFGLPKVTENAPQSLLSYIDDAYVGTFLEMYRKVEQGEPHASCEVWYKLRPGTEPRCERISYTTVYDHSGRPVKAYGIGQNITRQKLAQAEYDRMKIQLTKTKDGVVSGTQLNLSKNIYISGFSPYPNVEQSLRCKSADEHFAAAAGAIDNKELKAEVLKDFTCAKLMELFRNGIQQLEKTYPVRTSYGGIMWVRTTLQMIQNPGTGDVEAITSAQDITSQKRNNEIIDRLSSTGCDYIGVMDISAGTFEMHTSNWDCTDFAASQSMNYTDAAKMLSQYVAEDRRQAFLDTCDENNLSRLLDEKGQCVIAYDYIDTEVSDRPLKKQIIFSWLNDEKREILCVQQDVTEAYIKEQEQIAALQRAKLEADAANEAKSTFLSGMSHDLRTPLNGVLGFTAFALREKDPEKKQDYLRKVDTSGKLLLDLINDTLELSRIESGKAKLEVDAVMSEDLIPAVMTALRPSAELKHITYNTDIAADMNKPVWCDKLKVQKIALNLISNAIKYTLDGGTVSVTLRLEQADDRRSCYKLIVEDTGIGMSDEFVKRMYEPFAQEKRSESIKELGTGLGLSLVKNYLDLMGGTISVSSKIHAGTRFEVSIPICMEDRGTERVREEKTDLQRLAGRRILLCEDNYMNTEIAVMLLRDKAMTVDTAENGKAGLDIFLAAGQGAYDAILMDIRMPVMDGIEAVRRIRMSGLPDAATIPIIAMTADAFEESIREAKLSGMDDYLTKPIEPEEMYRTLLKYVK